jgi:hypothetical protein
LSNRKGERLLVEPVPGFKVHPCRVCPAIGKGTGEYSDGASCSGRSMCSTASKDGPVYVFDGLTPQETELISACVELRHAWKASNTVFDVPVMRAVGNIVAATEAAVDFEEVDRANDAERKELH